MFLSNKYSICYNSIIDRAKSRTLGEYTEIHHIIPKCLGGTNSKDNLVRLTGREHFICHRLLVRMVEGKAQHQMIKASAMMVVKNNRQNRYQVTSRLYEKLKKEAAAAMSVLTKGKPKHTEESKKILSIKATGRPSQFKGKRHSAEAREQLSFAKSKPCISPTGEKFPSTKAAGEAYGISGAAIRGRIERGTAGWRYERDEDQSTVINKLTDKKNKPKREYNPQTADHIAKRIAARKTSGHYKDREATIAKMSIARKTRNINNPISQS